MLERWRRTSLHTSSSPCGTATSRCSPRYPTTCPSRCASRPPFGRRLRVSVCARRRRCRRVGRHLVMLGTWSIAAMVLTARARAQDVLVYRCNNNRVPPLSATAHAGSTHIPKLVCSEFAHRCSIRDRTLHFDRTRCYMSVGRKRACAVDARGAEEHSAPSFSLEKCPRPGGRRTETLARAPVAEARRNQSKHKIEPPLDSRVRRSRQGQSRWCGMSCEASSPNFRLDRADCRREHEHARQQRWHTSGRHLSLCAARLRARTELLRAPGARIEIWGAHKIGDDINMTTAAKERRHNQSGRLESPRQE